MKKALSVLLIAAAVFGFYGSAVSVNDILACKDYWEEAGEKSTADMNKLEDGLNQLKDNEQAYLDGKDQVAEGEQTLADGEAQYAQGLADYAAAPGKLADARAQIAAGEAELAQGYADYAAAPKSLSDLDTLIAGLKSADYAFNVAGPDGGTCWKDGFEHKVSKKVLQDMAAGKETSDSPGLKQAREFLTQVVEQKKDMLDAAATMGGMKSSLSKKILKAHTYTQFKEALSSGIKPLAAAATKLEGLSGTVTQAVAAKQSEFAKAKDALAVPAAYRPNVAAQLKDVMDGVDTVVGLGIDASTSVDQLEAMIPGLPAPYQAKVQDLVDGIRANDLGSTLKEAKETATAGYALYSDPQATVAAGINAALAQLGGADSLSMVKSLDEDLYNTLTKDIGILTQQVTVPDSVFSATIDQFATDMTALAGALKEAAAVAESTSGTFQTWCDGFDQLDAGQKMLGLGTNLDDTGLRFAFQSMLTNKTLKTAIQQNAPSLIPMIRLFSYPTVLPVETFDHFDSDMQTITGSLIPALIPILQGVKAEGEKSYREAPSKLAAGEAALADGKRQYAEGLASYEAAPAQLAEAEQMLADGRAQLEDGKAQLAQYEDGEQQVRDGLATLFNTEADLDLESIADRLGGDGDFDNGDDHLELDEGLAAVEVGRGYQADDGVLITKEITSRAVGTAGLLGAGVLGVLAAILSFLKKNKGAGISALVAAAAGAFGAAYGSGAGTYFSDIAGSNVGSMAWIAAGVVGGVALIHAIVHLASPKNA